MFSCECEPKKNLMNFEAKWNLGENRFTKGPREMVPKEQYIRKI